jgi:polyhydroxyalkanoate synthesis regulator phasin
VIWDKSLRGNGLGGRIRWREAALYLNFNLRLAAIVLMLTAAAIPSPKREKDALQYGEGLIVNVPLPEPEVEKVVEDAARNTIIRGTKEYNKDEFITGAVGATSTPVFPAWTEDGKVFYKVRKQALDPRNFKDSNDVGTLAVRYVVQPQGPQNTVLRINAVFVEDFRRTVHASNGSVESSEYKDIQEHLDAIELMKKENAEALQAKQERMAKEKFGLDSDSNTVLLSTPPKAETPGDPQDGDTIVESTMGDSTSDQAAARLAQPPESLEQHIAELRQQVERLVKKPGAPLKSAPFHTAGTLKSLEPGVEVLILISTPYWYGVETHDGQHGWLRRDQLEPAQ